MSLILTFSPCDAHCSHFICSPAGFSLAQENSPLPRSPLSPQPHQLCLAFCLFLPPIRSLSRLSLPATFFSLPTHSLTSTVARVLQTPHKHPSSLYRTACLPRELNVFPSSSQNHLIGVLLLFTIPPLFWLKCCRLQYLTLSPSSEPYA